MKLTAYSLVPSSPLQYMHLGYTAAGWQNTGAPVFFVFALGCAVAAAMARKSVRSLAVFLVLTLVFLGGALWDYHRGEVRATRSRIMITEHQAKNCLEGTAQHADGRVLSTAELGKLEHSPTRLKDYWRHPFNFTQRKTATSTYYTLTSAGPDCKFDTGDDITVTKTVSVSEGKAQP